MKDRIVEPKRGDKGEWYFRMLGLETDSGPTTLQEVARNREAARTAELVTGMWEETTTSAPATRSNGMDDWAPAELSTTVTSRRRIRWPVLLLILLVVGAAGVALWWLPQASNQRAAAHSDLIEASISGLYSDLTDLQQSLALVTEPSSATPDLGTVAPSLSGVADSAARLLDIANEPVPAPLPLSPRDRFDALQLFKIQLEPIAAEATAIRSEVAAIAEYRLALGDVLDTAELPLTADSATVTAQTAALAEVLAASVAALNVMPGDGPFAAHRTLVDAEVSGFAQWQQDYLAALRRNDASAAGELVEALRLAQAGIAAELVVPLAELRSELDSRILGLADRLGTALGSIPS